MQKQLKTADVPMDWKLIDVLEETRRIGDCSLHLRGYACQRRRDQKIVTGSWAGWEEPSLDKAWLELHERLALMQAMDHPSHHVWPILDAVHGKKTGFISCAQVFPTSPDPLHMQFAKSNGVALGVSVVDAAQRAACEVVERHLILASWYGAFRPRPCSMTLPAALETLQSLYQFQHYDFGTFVLKDIGTITVRGTFLWPLQAEHPVIYGFGAALDETNAMHKSLSEAVQRLAFLDPLELPGEEPSFSPTPDFHQDYFLHPARRPMLKAWLDGGESHPTFSVDIGRSSEAQVIDLTPAVCPGAVVRVMISRTLPLAFGRYQPLAFPDLPKQFWIHPIV